MDEKNSPQGFATLKERFNKFFFSEEVPYGMAMMRISISAVLLICVLYRWPHARELFSGDGAPAPLTSTFGYSSLLPELPGTACIALYSVMVGFFTTSLIGWQTRISLMGANLLFFYFTSLDAISTITKYTVISNHLLLLLAVSQCGSLWSVDAWLKRKNRNHFSPGEPSRFREKFPVWPARLTQIFIGIVYLGAAATKLHTPDYFTGNQLKYWMVTNMNYSNPIGDFLSLHPIMLVVMAYIALIWEVLFVFTVWKGWTRTAMLTLGVIFHSMTTLTLGLYIFPLVCFSAYLSFFRTKDVQWITKHWRRFGRKQQWLNIRMPELPQFKGIESVYASSAYLFAAAAFLFALTGVQAEHLLDPYGLRRADGPYALKPMDRQLAEKLLTEKTPLRPKDQFFSFDVGRMMAGGTVINSSPVFRQGEKILLQATLIPPHADLYVNCELRDSNGGILDDISQVVPREWEKVNFHYTLDESVEPGQYELVLKANSQEVDRKLITLKQRGSSVWSN